MADKKFRRMTIAIETKKILETSGGTYTHRTNDQRQHGQDGSMGHSEGNDETELQFDTCTPFGGHDNRANIRDALAGKRSVTATIFVDGGIEILKNARFVERKYTSDSKTGELKGSFQLEGGKPEIM